MILRSQLTVLQRHQPCRPKLTWRTGPARNLLGLIPKARPQGLRLLVTPHTVLRWHRDIVRRRRAARAMRGETGRPATHRNITALTLRLTRENPSWGYRRIHGETAWPGSKGSTADSLGDPEERRNRLRAEVTELGVTVRPDSPRVVRGLQIPDSRPGLNFTASFDAVFQAADTTILRTAVQVPRMNATCEWPVGTLRRELHDRMLILGEAHLRAVLAEYQAHFHTARPHQGSASASRR